MHRNRGIVGIGYFGCLYGKMMDRVYGMVNGYMEWLMDIWIGLRKYVILSPPPDYKLVQNLTASYGGGGGSVARSSSSLNYVHICTVLI